MYLFFDLQGRNIGQRHLIARHDKRTLHNRLCRVQRGQTRSAAFHSDSAQLKAVAVGNSAVGRGVDNQRNIARIHHIENVRAFTRKLVDGLRVNARLHKHFARAGRCVEFELGIFNSLSISQISALSLSRTVTMILPSLGSDTPPPSNAFKSASL